MTPGTLQPDAQKDLGGGFGQIGRVRNRRHVGRLTRRGDEVGRTVLEDRTLGGDQLACELVIRLVLSQRLADPVVVGPHPGVTGCLAVVAEHIRELQRPVRAPLVDIPVPRRITCQPQDLVHQPAPFPGVLRSQEPLDHRRLGQRAQAIQERTADEVGVAASGRRTHLQQPPPPSHLLVDQVHSRRELGLGRSHSEG